MNTKSKIVCVIVFLLITSSQTLAAADQKLKVHGLFRSNMVLQRDKPIAIWGWAPSGTEVKVSFGKLTAAGKATGDKVINSNAPTMRNFVRQWQGSEVAKGVAEKCNGLGQKELDGILGAERVSPGALKRFLGTWVGFPVYDKALVRYDAMTSAHLEKLKRAPTKDARAKYLLEFARKWKPATCVAEALRLLIRSSWVEPAATSCSRIRQRFPATRSLCWSAPLVPARASPSRSSAMSRRSSLAVGRSCMARVSHNRAPVVSKQAKAR